jgi:hypothetical protein
MAGVLAAIAGQPCPAGPGARRRPDAVRPLRRPLPTGRIAHHVATAPDRADEVVRAGLRQLLAELADEHVDDLDLGLVHAAVQMVQECLLREDHAFPESEQLEHGVFLARQMHRAAADRHVARREIQGQIADRQGGLGEPLGPPDDGLDAGHQLLLVEWFRDEVVGPHAEALHLGLWPGEAGQDQYRRFDPRGAQAPHHLIAFHIRKDQVEDHDVVIVEPRQFERFFAAIDGVHHHGGRLQHRHDTTRGCEIIFDE